MNSNNQFTAPIIEGCSLGSASFKETYKLQYAMVAGAMYKGIASADLVIAMAKHGMLGFLGTGGMRLDDIEKAILKIQAALVDGQTYGMNLLHQVNDPDHEHALISLYLKYNIPCVEAAAHMDVTEAIVRYRLTGLERDSQGKALVKHHVIAKVSRPEVAEAFMRPAPTPIVTRLLSKGLITEEQAALSRHVPIASDICVESDSGGHTDQAVALAALPAMRSLATRLQREHNYTTPLRIGAAGGIGTPEAIAGVIIMGADFIVTGSINQCTVEASTSDAVKDMLQEINVQDTEYAPAGDMFEYGAKVQVLKRGVLFPARANKLYALYKQFDSLDTIDEKTLRQIEDKYFHRSVNEVWEETRAYYMNVAPDQIKRAEESPKHRMALVFRWYFIHSTRLARNGETKYKSNFQVHTGPALGAFNQWVKGTYLADWQNREVAEINKKLIHAAAELIQTRFSSWLPAQDRQVTLASHEPIL